MKKLTRFVLQRCSRVGSLVLTAALFSGYSAMAGTDKKPVTPEEDPIFDNWITLSLGGLITNGNQAQFQQSHPISGPVFGGIDDMHLQKDVQAFGRKGELVLDAHAIWANSDYRVQLLVNVPDLGYVKGGYTEFCTYSNGNGGFLNFPDGGTTSFYSGPEWELYRGLAWFEAGLRVPNLPQVTFRYEHAFRVGQEDSTSWGSTNQLGQSPDATSGTVRKTVPSFRNINEQRDTIMLDLSQRFGKPEAVGSTLFKLGMRMDWLNNQDQLNWQALPGVSNVTSLATGNQPFTATNRYASNPYNIPPTSVSHYFLTDTENQNSNIYNGHASTETNFGDKVLMTIGYGYTTVASHFSGDRIAGPDYGTPTWQPYINNLPYGSASGAWTSMGGESSSNQSVAVLNFLITPIESLSITPSIRLENDEQTSATSYLPIIGQSAPQTVNAVGVTNQKYYVWGSGLPVRQAPSRVMMTSSDKYTDIAEGLDIRYTGIENVVLYATGEWNQISDQRTTNTPAASLQYYPAAATPTTGNLTAVKDLNFNGNLMNFTQKYSVGANWYPTAHVNVAVQYYVLYQQINQNIASDDNASVLYTWYPTTRWSTNVSTSTNQRLLSQNWITNDVNFRLTWRPLSNLSFVSRYDFQETRVSSMWASTGQLNDPLGDTTGSTASAPGLSSVDLTNIVSESVTWNPLDRLYIQGNISLVWNTISSPASTLTPSITNSNNNYVTASLGAGYSIDNKTQVRADLSYYRANDYYNNSQYGVPYGAGATEWTFSIGINRQISRNVGVSLKYYVDNYVDVLSGGHNNYTAQVIASSLKVQF